MAYHLTASGGVKLLCTWGHGRGVPSNTARPATLIAEAHHYTVSTADDLA